MKRKNNAWRKKARHEAATERAEYFANLSLEDKLERLETRGHGHCAEAYRYREELKAGRVVSAE